MIHYKLEIDLLQDLVIILKVPSFIYIYIQRESIINEKEFKKINSEISKVEIFLFLDYFYGGRDEI